MDMIEDHIHRVHPFDMICIVLKETIIRNLFCSCCFEKKKITDVIFKITIGPAQRNHSIIEETHCKKVASVISCYLWVRKCQLGK